MFIHRADGEPFAFAGLWEVWRDPNATEAEREAGGGTLRSCTIITSAANEKMPPIHDRMPVMLPRDAWETWLDPADQDIEVGHHCSCPHPPRCIDIYPVSTEVNNVRNKGGHLIDPVDPTLTGELPGQATLL